MAELLLSAYRFEPVVVRPLVDSFKQGRAQVPLSGIRQHREDDGAFFGFLGNFERSCQSGAGGDADENTFFCRQLSRYFDCPIVRQGMKSGVQP
jgi:hypothetical protein